MNSNLSYSGAVIKSPGNTDISDKEMDGKKSKEGKSWLPSTMMEMEYDPEHWSSVMRCTVCLEFMNEPDVLSCGHSFCHKCIGDMIKYTQKCNPNVSAGNQTLMCPMCRRRQKVQSCIRYTPRNITLHNAIEGWTKSDERAHYFKTKTTVFTDQCIQTEVGVECETVGTQTSPGPTTEEMCIQTDSELLINWKQAQTSEISTMTEKISVDSGCQAVVLTATCDSQTTMLQTQTAETQTTITQTKSTSTQTDPETSYFADDFSLALHVVLLILFSGFAIHDLEALASQSTDLLFQCDLHLCGETSNFLFVSSFAIGMVWMIWVGGFLGALAATLICFWETVPRLLSCFAFTQENIVLSENQDENCTILSELNPTSTSPTKDNESRNASFDHGDTQPEDESNKNIVNMNEAEWGDWSESTKGRL